ncbi:hypothetical protein [Massilia sp. TSP1-1-2]|uniref:hypothetical protein n=1 Tax=Massilia sp. TSP1-1-2 TaxID=2804649 RepID=UPI003CEFA8C1
MPTRLSFETGPVQLSLRHSAVIEHAPAITVQMHATGDAQIYTADAQALHDARWVMTITSACTPQPFTLSYAAAGERAQCSVAVNQSAQRFALLLEMFKGGAAFEILIDIEGLIALSDYSRKWDTHAVPVLAVSSVCFEFPLPQSEH